MITHKSEVLKYFKTFKSMAENQLNMKIKILRSDNGTEYVNHDFDNFCKQEGILHQKTVPYSPQQNGISERANRTIVEKARCMLIDSGLSKGFWAEAVCTAVYIINRIPNKTNSQPPEQIWSEKPVIIYSCVWL